MRSEPQSECVDLDKLRCPGLGLQQQMERCTEVKAIGGPEWRGLQPGRQGQDFNAIYSIYIYYDTKIRRARGPRLVRQP